MFWDSSIIEDAFLKRCLLFHNIVQVATAYRSFANKAWYFKMLMCVNVVQVWLSQYFPLEDIAANYPLRADATKMIVVMQLANKKLLRTDKL